MTRQEALALRRGTADLQRRPRLGVQAAVDTSTFPYRPALPMSRTSGVRASTIWPVCSAPQPEVDTVEPRVGSGRGWLV
jgi:hypothetical protein